MSITSILRKYTEGEYTLEETNKKLKEANSNLHLDTEKNVIHENEIHEYGLLDTGTVTLDKVHIVNYKMVNADAVEGDIVFFDGEVYRVAEDGITVI